MARQRNRLLHTQWSEAERRETEGPQGRSSEAPQGVQPRQPGCETDGLQDKLREPRSCRLQAMRGFWGGARDTGTKTHPPTNTRETKPTLSHEPDQRLTRARIHPHSSAKRPACSKYIEAFRLP